MDEACPLGPTVDPPDRLTPGLTDLVPEDTAQAYDVRRVIEQVVDRGSFLEVQSLFAPNLTIGFARMQGRVIGLVANQPMKLAGCLDSNASRKGARFIRFCDAFRIPIVSLVDVPGFLPGREQEHSGVIGHGAKLLYAYCESTVPKLSVILRKAYGGAYIVMSSKHLGGDINLAWPNAEIAVMGAKGAVEILHRRVIAEHGVDSPEVQEHIREYETRFQTPDVATSHGFIDRVIEPSETRKALCEALLAMGHLRKEIPDRIHGNMPT
jgi:acetyl-CoA carboxylase carboxyltransferase component